MAFGALAVWKLPSCILHILAYGLDLLERLVSGFELVMGIIQCFGRVYHFRFKGGSKLEQLPHIARV
jgi:hypothetical protein